MAPRMMDRDAFGDLLKVFVGLKDSREPLTSGVCLVFRMKLHLQFDLESLVIFVFSAVNLSMLTG